MSISDSISWLQDWYSKQCNGDWEHTYGILIDTLDNPGWRVTIDLKETSIESLSIEYLLVEVSSQNWYGFSVENGKFKGAGDPTKLGLLLEKFREIIEEYGNMSQ